MSECLTTARELLYSMAAVLNHGFRAEHAKQDNALLTLLRKIEEEVLTAQEWVEEIRTNHKKED